MKRFAIAVIKRLLVSIAVLTSIAGFGLLFGYLVGPSKPAALGAEILIAWPWTLPQVFIVVSITWFVVQRIKRSWNRIHIDPASPAN
jgi:hypothetical protein